MTARGLKNNNPGNIKHSSRNKWQGLDKPPSDDKGFCRFSTMPYGVRAIAVLLTAYQDRFHCDNVSDLISRWAPSGADANPTDRYIQFVAGKLGVSAHDEIDTHDHLTMRTLVEAIIRFENGSQPLTESQINAGLALAGLKPPEKPLQQTRTVKGAQIATVGTTGAAGIGVLVDQVKDATDQISPIVHYSKYLMLAFAGLTLLGIGLTVWARYDDRRKGVN